MMAQANTDEAGKLFVGGLSWETNKDNLQHYFSQYGEVVDSVVMRNPATGRSRGFGFVTFKDTEAVSRVLQAGPHELDGRTIDPKACTPKGEQQKGKKDDAVPKLFLGGLPSDITETELRSAFMEFGTVSDVVIMYDQVKKKPRGFGFLTYDSEESVEKACRQRFVTVGGKQVECKRAEPRSASRGRPEWGGNDINGQNRSWGSAPGGNDNLNDMGSGAPNGSLSSGYQSWASQVQQAPYNQQSSYNSGYQQWNSAPSGYGNTASNYGQSDYTGYGAASNYNYSQGAGAPVPSEVASSDPTSSTSAASPTVHPPPQTAVPYAGSVGGYTQESSNYGPSRGGYAGTADNTQTYGSNQEYGSSTSTYGSYGGNTQSGRSQNAGQHSYHPYRR